MTEQNERLYKVNHHSGMPLTSRCHVLTSLVLLISLFLAVICDRMPGNTCCCVCCRNTRAVSTEPASAGQAAGKPERCRAQPRGYPSHQEALRLLLQPSAKTQLLSLQPHLSSCNRHYLITPSRETEEIFFESMCQSPK